MKGVLLYIPSIPEEDTHSMNQINCVQVQLITVAAARTAAPLTTPQHTAGYKGHSGRGECLVLQRDFL